MQNYSVKEQMMIHKTIEGLVGEPVSLDEALETYYEIMES